jgi:hypothetical protein
MSREELRPAPGLAGLRFLSDSLERFADGPMHLAEYRLSRSAVPDTASAFEAWLHDRCAAFLVAHAHLGHERYRRHAFRARSFLTGDRTLLAASRYLLSEWDDFERCVDATALTAAGIRALARQGRSGGPGVGPFATEGDETAPARKPSWWFNTSMLQLRLPDGAGVSFAELRPGAVQPDGGCSTAGGD